MHSAMSVASIDQGSEIDSFLLVEYGEAATLFDISEVVFDNVMMLAKLAVIGLFVLIIKSCRG